MGAPSTGGRELYRPGRLELRGLAYFVTAPPDARYEYAEAGAICVDLCDAEPDGPVPPVRAGDFAARFYVTDWNAFISVSAREAVMEWTGAAFDRGGGDDGRA